MTTFLAYEITEDTTYQGKVTRKEMPSPEAGQVLVQVHYSSLNYKDALSASGNKGVTKNYPHTPGIDAAGLVVEAPGQEFETGDRVIVTGYDLGMNTCGGFGQYILVPAAWLVKCPQGLSLKESMAYGTAGLTAALSVLKLIKSGIQADQGPILVTGATGGVGSIAIGLLNHLGYQVIASTGKAHEKDHLLALGAQDIVDRQSLNDKSGRPMLKGQWASVIDTVGGNTLATALKSTKYGGVVTTCGNVSDPNFTSSVYPFIIRGVSLMGVDSVLCPHDLRQEVWTKLATTWKINLTDNCHEVGLEALSSAIDAMVKGLHVGRTLLCHTL